MINIRNGMKFCLTGLVLTTATLGVPSFVSAQEANLEAVQDTISTSGALSAGAKSYYANAGYKPMWVGAENELRANALVSALRASGNHGLPTANYNIAELEAALNAANGSTADGIAEELATAAFLSYAHDVGSGILEPVKIDEEMAVAPPRRSEPGLLKAMARSSGKIFLASLAPKTPEYKRLMAEKVRMEDLVASTDYGPAIPVKTLKPGRTHDNVVLMRSKLKSLGYGELGDSRTYDDELVEVVKTFQTDNQMSADGVAGRATLTAMNLSAEQKLKQVLVNLERERWMNFDRGQRHIVVNIPDFTVAVFDDKQMTHQTRVVVGKSHKDRTPEFYDQMTHLVVNPTWHVPKSIAGKEYLPMLKKDPTALKRRGLRLLSRKGGVDAEQIDWSQYSANNFPFSIKQPPGQSNALGRVKFIFPNRFNIYLHDTPSKNLFNKDVRAFSHGCIRVKDPYDLAYKLLAKQTSDPQEAFQAWLDTRREQFVHLEQPVPVYLTYRTAFVDVNGEMRYRADVYGRDKKVFNALTEAGVALQSVQG